MRRAACGKDQILDSHLGLGSDNAEFLVLSNAAPRLNIEDAKIRQVMKDLPDPTAVANCNQNTGGLTARSNKLLRSSWLTAIHRYPSFIGGIDALLLDCSYLSPL